MDTYSGPISFNQFSKSPVTEVNVHKEGLEMHHVSRIPEKVIPVCVKCHRGIELGHLRPDLKPERSRRDFIGIKRMQNRQKREDEIARKREIQNRIWRNRLYRRF